MQILNGAQVREWDRFTIDHLPISSIDLMEKAAIACTEWLMGKFPSSTLFNIFCGKGNNGGDGLAIARLLSLHDYKVNVYILEFGHLGSEDFQNNLQRLHGMVMELRFIPREENFPSLESPSVIIDALYGSGLNRPLDGLSAQLVDHINAAALPVIAIDIPSGMFIDRSSKGNAIIQAEHTLTFQCLKPAFLVAENEPFTGTVRILDIGLDNTYLKDLKQHFVFVEEDLAKAIFRPRKKFSHKGSFGHSLLVCGSFGKMGAALLAAKACVHTGTGLLTMHIPKSGYGILQSSCPEAMVVVSGNDTHIDDIAPQPEKYDAIGVGPGIGTSHDTAEVLKKIITSYKGRLVMDADALNILSMNPGLLKQHKASIIITPHPKEMERLFGKVNNDFERIEQAIKKAKEFNLVIVLKGRYTCITTPGGMTYFNSSGNPGLAKGGTGDTLTGMLTALMANGYSAEASAILGCYLHGKSADLAVEFSSEESITPTDLIKHIGKSFRSLYL